MSAIMRALRNDHRNLSRLMDLLTEQLDIIQGEGKPDFELIMDVVEYVDTYPDLVHHPREDALFERYLERYDDGLRGSIEVLMEEHRHLRDLTSALRMSVDGVLHDSPLEREAFIGQLAAFIARQRRHIDMEEGEVFPALEQRLSEEDWQAAEERVPAKADPLFGEEVQNQFSALYRRIAD